MVKDIHEYVGNLQKANGSAANKLRMAEATIRDMARENTALRKELAEARAVIQSFGQGNGHAVAE